VSLSDIAHLSFCVLLTALAHAIPHKVPPNAAHTAVSLAVASLSADHNIPICVPAQPVTQPANAHLATTPSLVAALPALANDQAAAPIGAVNAASPAN